MELEVKNLADCRDRQVFPKGTFENVSVGGMDIGRATYEPGWKWSTHVGLPLGQTTCPVDHIVLVLSGHMRIAMNDGTEFDVGPGDVCAIPGGHDAWVLGDEPYVSLHFHGTQAYAAPNQA